MLLSFHEPASVRICLVPALLLDCIPKQELCALLVSLSGAESSDETSFRLLASLGCPLDPDELELVLLHARSLDGLGLERTSVRESLLHLLLDEGIARSSSSLQRLLELHWPRLTSVQGLLTL